MVERYIPDRGDIVWIEFNPQMGHEQAGRRPALIISPKLYNGRVGLALICPITKQMKGYPFEVKLPAGLQVSGVILADQIKNLDWQVRKAEFICEAPEEVIAEVLGKIRVLIE